MYTDWLMLQQVNFPTLSLIEIVLFKLFSLIYELVPPQYLQMNKLSSATLFICKLEDAQTN